VRIQAFFTKAVVGSDGQLYVPAVLLPRKYPHEVGWSPNLVWATPHAAAVRRSCDHWPVLSAEGYRTVVFNVGLAYTRNYEKTS
jgi:hypothetical protein